MKHWNAFLGTLVILFGLSTGCGYPVGKYANPMNGRVAKSTAPVAPKEVKAEPAAETVATTEVPFTEEAEVETYADAATDVQPMVGSGLNQLLAASRSAWQVDQVMPFQAPKWVKKTFRRKMERVESKAGAQGLDRQLRLIIILAAVAIIIALVAGILAAITGGWGLWWIMQVAAGIIMVIALVLGLIYLINEVL